MGGAMDCTSYNLFCRKVEPDLFCAVPEDRPVPAFVDGGNWLYAGRINRPSEVVGWFSGSRARMGVRHVGFYLFQRCGKIEASQPANVPPPLACVPAPGTVTEPTSAGLARSRFAGCRPGRIHHRHPGAMDDTFDPDAILFERLLRYLQSPSSGNRTGRCR